MSVTINRDEWLAALSAANIPTEDDPSAVTIGEFAAMLGTGRVAAQLRLDTLVTAGLATRTHKSVAVAGRGPRLLIAYKLVTETPRRKGATHAARHTR